MTVADVDGDKEIVQVENTSLYTIAQVLYLPESVRINCLVQWHVTPLRLSVRRRSLWPEASVSAMFCLLIIVPEQIDEV